MSEEEKHFTLEIQDLIDGRLDPNRREQVKSHIANCKKCGSEFEQLNLIKQIVQKEIQTVATPGDVKNKILRDLQSESIRIPQDKSRFNREFLIAAAAIIVVFLVAGFLFRYTALSPIPSLVEKDYGDYIGGSLILGVHSSKPKEIEKFFTRNGIPFHTRVFDLAMMQYHLQGGKVHRLGRQPSALFVYKGPNRQTMVCQMFPGSIQELPQSEIRNHNGIRFFVYDENEITMVFWQEGEIICVLASDAGKEEVIQLAFAKAVKI